jgi:hypothetical protein
MVLDGGFDGFTGRLTMEIAGCFGGKRSGMLTIGDIIVFV